MTLDKQQLEAFDRDGFLLLREFASSDKVRKIRNKAKLLIKNPVEPIESEESYHNYDTSVVTLRRLRQVYDRDLEFSAWMKSKKIFPVLKQILRDTPVLTLAHHNSIMTKMPSKISSTCWHQDRRYWHFENENLVSVWLALGKERISNGVLEFIPGSHKMKFSENQFDEKQCFRTDIEENKNILAKKIHYNLNPGDVVIFHCKTLHSAPNNKTDKPKISFVYTVKGEKNGAISGTRSSKFPELVLG